MGKARCNSGRAFRKEKTTVLRLSWDMCGAKVKKISAQARKDIAENKWSDTIGAIEAPPTIRNAVATLSLDASNGRRNVRPLPSRKTRRMGTRLRSISQEERSMAQRSKLFSVLKEKQIQSHVALFDWSRTVEGCHQCRYQNGRKNDLIGPGALQKSVTASGDLKETLKSKHVADSTKRG